MDKKAISQVRMDSELKDLSMTSSKRTLGLANGKYKIPDDIDESNDEIAEMFGAYLTAEIADTMKVSG